MGLGANFTLRDMLILTMTSIRTHSVLKTQFLWVIGFHGSILFSVSLIPVYRHRIWYFPMMVVKRRGGEGRGWHVSEEKGDEKRKRRLIHVSALCYFLKLLLFDRSD